MAADYRSNGTLIQSVTFQYDVFGNRVEEDDYNASTQVTTVTKFAYDAAGNIWADLNGSNQLVDRRLFVDVNGQTQPFARIDSSGHVSWYLNDHLGSVRLITDNSAAVIDQIDYDAWGNITNETNATNGDRYKYASGQYDAILGMTLYAHNSTGRWYMASNGNWLNADPTGLAAGPNPYDYVSNDPANGIDPSGLSIVSVAVKHGADWGFNVRVGWKGAMQAEFPTREGKKVVPHSAVLTTKPEKAVVSTATRLLNITQLRTALRSRIIQHITGKVANADVQYDGIGKNLIVIGNVTTAVAEEPDPETRNVHYGYSIKVPFEVWSSNDGAVTFGVGGPLPTADDLKMDPKLDNYVPPNILLRKAGRSDVVTSGTVIVTVYDELYFKTEIVIAGEKAAVSKLLTPPSEKPVRPGGFVRFKDPWETKVPAPKGIEASVTWQEKVETDR